MPKIIENLREQLLSEAKRQIVERGYAKTTIRSVAGACGVGVGTVYNYFPSKDILIASFMLDDWFSCIEKIKSAAANDSRALMLDIHTTLLEFVSAHRSLFCDTDTTKVFYTVFAERHKLLRDQISEVLLAVCRGDVFKSQFISEALLTWTTEGKSFDEIYPIIEKILN